MARVKLIVSRDDLAAEHHALFDELAALRGRISGPSTVVLHSPGLARPWNEISEFLHRHSVVGPSHPELAVCATARQQDCGYIRNAHLPLARPPLSTARVEPITRREQVPEAHRAIFDTVAEGRGSVRGPFSILMYSPVLCRRLLDVGTFLRFNSRLEADSRELAILAAAREKDCPYIWAAHAPTT